MGWRGRRLGLSPRHALPARLRAGVRRLTLWSVALLAFLPSAREAPAEGESGLRPPSVQVGLPVGDGTLLWRHPGADAPPDVAGATWSLEVVGQRTFGGRTVDVLRYVARDPEGRAVGVRTYEQADFVDPATGRVVGGLDGWGREAYPDEPPAPSGCGPVGGR